MLQSNNNNSEKIQILLKSNDKDTSPFVQQNVSKKKLVMALVNYLDDSQLNFYIYKKAKGSVLIDLVFEQMGLVERDYFGLTFYSNRKQHWLYPKKKIYKQLKGVQLEFFFKVKFYPPQPTQLVEDFTRHLLYLQLRKDVYSERLPVSFAAQASLGSLVAQAELGDFQSSENYAQHLSNAKIAQPTSEQEQFCNKVGELHKLHRGLTRSEAELAYLNECKSLAIYGIHLLRSKAKKRKAVQTATSSAGSPTRSHSRSSKRTYTTDSSSEEMKEKEEKVIPKIRDYGPDASSWRMYEIEKEKAMSLSTSQTSTAFPLSSRGRDPNLVSTLRKPYVPGGGRKAHAAYFKLAAANGLVIRGRGRGRGIAGLRGRGRGRGRGKGIMRFYGPLRPKSDYLDASGKIDRKKLLEIATENATKLAMEGKLPKGEELLEAIKTKSMEQLATISKQLEDEQLKVASAPVPFVRWMSSTFALALEQQQNPTLSTFPRGKRGFIPIDSTAHLMEKISSSEDEADKEELFQRRHASWKQRTEKRAKEREADEAEEDGDKSIGAAKGGQAFKRSGPMQLATRDIKIKIAPSQSGFSVPITSTSALPPPPPLPSIKNLLPNIPDIDSSFPSSSSLSYSFASKSSTNNLSETTSAQKYKLPIQQTQDIQQQHQQQLLNVTSLFMKMDIDSVNSNLQFESQFSLSSKRRNEDEEMDVFDESKKRRLPGGDDIGHKLVNMIKKLDEDLNGGSVENAIGDLALVLEANLDPYEGQIIQILYECAAYLPEKLTIFSTLVGLLNARSEDFGKALITKFIIELHTTFVKEDYEIFIRLFRLHFFVILVILVLLLCLLFLNFLQISLTMPWMKVSNPTFLIYSVLHSLPWIGPALNEDLTEPFDSLLKKIDSYIEKRKKEHTTMLQVWSDQKVLQFDYLNSLWQQLKNLRSQNCLDTSIISAGKNYPLPRDVFRLFSCDDLPEDEPPLPEINSIERFLVEEDLNWIIDNNFTDRKSCADALLVYYRKEAIPLNYMIIEVIFGQLFRLPKSSHCEIFYSSLLIELCRSQSNSMPQVLAMAAELLFQRVETMQIICIDRFVDWFSFHLSNFEYRWSWSDWIYCVEFDSLHPKRIFIREVIDRCLRLSYHKKLIELLPNEFGPLIPDEPTISYVLDDENHLAFNKAEQFKLLISQRAKDEEILDLLTESNINEDEQVGNNERQIIYSEELVAVFFAVLLKLASKTLTHSFAALTRYNTTMTILTHNNEAMQSIILRTLYDSWSLNKQMMTVLVEKMIKMNILEPAIVQAWVFSDEMKVEFKKTWVWDVLSAAVIHLERRQKLVDEALRSVFFKYLPHPMAMATFQRNSIFSNVAETSEGKVYWEGLEDEIKDKDIKITDWLGNPWKLGESTTPAAHPNSRFCAPAKQCPIIHPNWESPKGVPIDAIIFGGRYIFKEGVRIDAIIFGGRRPEGVPLVFECFFICHILFSLYLFLTKLL
ncbi:hypothetical protein Mgra_00001869 [Meloidogyne graminicola]|uniref:Nuclear cap-binding protein subunit 1 n=1 Tax=Meloidogyne graminicola TaxID=189291 RepID=A0A8S9ZZU2_9BILA|nr:hypothetical protein Mgra_00001869 [Meloidogyne graminicola]